MRRLALFLAAAAAAPLGCSVGSGSGAASGSLFAFSCRGMAPLGTETSQTEVAPIPYNLAPEFFAGVPIDDPVQGPGAMNVLGLRMQSTGLEQMYADTLEFDVLDSFEVARCLRGRTINGQPDYLVYQPLPLALATQGNSTPTTLWCDWSGMAFGPDGGAADAATAGTPDAGSVPDGGMPVMASAPRIHITPYTDIHASLSLGQTCPGAVIAGAGLDGWIELQNFGTAEQSDKAPADRDEVQPSFLVNYGDRVSAKFDFTIGDPQMPNAVLNGGTPPTRPVIGGHLSGYFDFILAQGRSLQPFE